MGWEDPFVENPPSPVSFRPRLKWLLIESKLTWRGNYAVYGIIRHGTSSGELNFMALRALHSRKLTPGKVKELEIVAFKGEQNGGKGLKNGPHLACFFLPPVFWPTCRYFALSSFVSRYVELYWNSFTRQRARFFFANDARNQKSFATNSKIFKYLKY